MMKKINLVASLVLLLMSFEQAAVAQSSLPLNTGYNHAGYAPYPTVIGTSSVQDNYWINIASFPATTPPVASSWVLEHPVGWWVPLPGSHWISARNSVGSAPGTASDNPSYTIFRKCFCLLPGFKEAKLNFQVRADDNITIWFNTILNQVLAPSPGQSNSPTPLSGGTSKGFVVGKNCLYALVEDTTPGKMGFNLAGDVSAYGLLPTAAFGENQSFEPCVCRKGRYIPTGESLDAGANSRGTLRAADDDDRQVIREIVKAAEERRAARRRGTPLRN